MRKLLLLFIAMPAFIFGQGFNDFESVTLPTAYGDGSFTNDGVTYTYGRSRDQDTYPIEDNGLLMQRASDSYLEWTVTNGIGQLDFEYRKAYTGNNVRQLELLVNGTQVATSPTFGGASGEDATIYTFSHAVNQAGIVTIRIKNVGNTATSRQTVIDNIAWTDYTAPAGCDITASGLANVLCNDNNTGADATDDFVTFTLNPTGNDLGTGGYNVSVSAGTITPTTAAYGQATTFTLQNGSAGAGDVTLTITDVNDGACSFTESITDPGTCSSTTPVLNAAPASLTGFNHIVGTPSSSQTITVDGIALQGDVTVAAPTNFEVSLDNTIYTASVLLTPTAGTLASTTVYVRANAAVYGTLSGNLAVSSLNATTVNIALSGFADDYIYRTIDEINGYDATTGIADSLNKLVKITGVVQCMDYRAGSGYNMVIIDGTEKGMYIFSTSDKNGYTDPVAGDSIQVKGKVDQFNGLTQVRVDEIQLLKSGSATTSPTVVTMLDESTENQVVRLENLTFVTPTATFPSGSANMDVTDGTNTFTIRVLASMNLAGTATPQGPFNVSGIGSQFDSSNPHLAGYQLLPCGADAFEEICTGANLPDVSVNQAANTLTANASTGVTYQWINCATNAAIAGATNQSFTATTPGSYAVVVSNATCSDTSTCFTVSDASVQSIALENAVKAYPNPFENELTLTASQTVQFTITDMNGKVIVATSEMKDKVTISTENWNRGVYFVTVKGGDQSSYTVKVVK
ncbi:MAG: T9SS type A sorting domain-containing protein [Crocinitomicaceae bacterium]